MRQIEEAGVVPATGLEAIDAEEIPASFAALGKGTAEDGTACLVTWSPRRATDALLAALAVGGRMAADEGFTGTVYAVAPSWSTASRRLLGSQRELPFPLRPVAAPALAEGTPEVEPEPAQHSPVLSASQIAGHLSGPAERELFLRAARALEGLAAKHGGALRGCGRSLEFVLLARRVAELRAESGGVLLRTLLPQRSEVQLSVDSLSTALDTFEGQLRKRLNDRRTREGEEGLRAQAIVAFRSWHSLRALVSWPLGGQEVEVIDWVGVDVEGRPVLGAARRALSLDSLGAIVDAALRLHQSLPTVLAHAALPVVLDTPRLVLGGQEIGAGVSRVLESLTLAHELFEMRPSRDGSLELVAMASGEAAARERPPRQRGSRRRGGRDRAVREAEDAETPGEQSAEGVAADTVSLDVASADAASADADDSAAEEGSGRSEGRGEGRGRSRRRGRRRGGRGERTAEAESSAAVDSKESEPGTGPAIPDFEQISVFDLDDEPAERSESGRGRGRGRGSRRRGRRSGGGGSSGAGGEGDSGDEASSTSREEPAAAADSNNGSNSGSNSELDNDVDDDFGLAEDGVVELSEIPDEEELQTSAPSYDEDEDEDEDGEADDGDSESHDRTVEREKLRRTRRATAQPEPEVEQLRLPRKRGAILAHADRDSLVAAILLAREIRMVEGIWVYPQSELMNFFRNVTTDLREDIQIYVIGFTPSPARDVLQAASLYSGRLQWFDHHIWPPEDLQALNDVLGTDAVTVAQGAGTSLPAVVEACARRSRFTDKLVDLTAARFSQHDYERWGRLWWWRLGQAVEKTGECRADVEALLSGRPSDLAREAAGHEPPPIPPEVEYVSKRDFRLVHFAGYGLVVVDAPPEQDLHLTARIARERYGASLSLAYRPTEERVIFACDELAGRRSLDLGGLVDHVAQKLEYVEALADDDHVARFRIKELPEHPERLDDVVRQIAMGRSSLER